MNSCKTIIKSCFLIFFLPCLLASGEKNECLNPLQLSDFVGFTILDEEADSPIADKNICGRYVKKISSADGVNRTTVRVAHIIEINGQSYDAMSTTRYVDSSAVISIIELYNNSEDKFIIACTKLKCDKELDSETKGHILNELNSDFSDLDEFDKADKVIAPQKSSGVFGFEPGSKQEVEAISGLFDGVESLINHRLNGSSTFDESINKYNDNAKKIKTDLLEKRKSIDNIKEDLMFDAFSSLFFNRVQPKENNQSIVKDIESFSRALAPSDIRYNSSVLQVSDSEFSLILNKYKGYKGSADIKEVNKLLDLLGSNIFNDLTQEEFFDLNGFPKSLYERLINLEFTRRIEDPVVLSAMQKNMHYLDASSKQSGSFKKLPENQIARKASARLLIASYFKDELSKDDIINNLEFARRLSLLASSVSDPSEKTKILEDSFSLDEGDELFYDLELEEESRKNLDKLTIKILGEGESVSRDYSQIEIKDLKKDFENLDKAYQFSKKLAENQNSVERQNLLEFGDQFLKAAANRKEEVLKSNPDTRVNLSDDELYSLGVDFLDAGLGFVPVVGVAKDFYEAVVGKKLLDGKELSAYERVFAAVGVATLGVGSKFKHVHKALEKVDPVLFKKALGQLESFGSKNNVAEIINKMRRSGGIYVKEFNEAAKNINRSFKAFSTKATIRNKLPVDGYFSRVMTNKKYAENIIKMVNKIKNGVKVRPKSASKLAPDKTTFIGQFQDISDYAQDSKQVAKRLSLFEDIKEPRMYKNYENGAVLKWKFKNSFIDHLKNTSDIKDVKGLGFLPGGKTLGGASEWIIDSDLIRKRPELFDLDSFEIIYFNK